MRKKRWKKGGASTGYPSKRAEKIDIVKEMLKRNRNEIQAKNQSLGPRQKEKKKKMEKHRKKEKEEKEKTE